MVDKVESCPECGAPGTSGAENREKRDNYWVCEACGYSDCKRCGYSFSPEWSCADTQELEAKREREEE